MCGRFQLSVKGKHISERFNVEVFDEMYSPNYNCAPSQILPVITNTAVEALSFFQWGLIPFWANNPKIGFKLINARGETLAEKPAFRQAFEKHRCLIPANGFYEWRKNDKTPFRIFLKNEDLFAFAGIWETWKDTEDRLIHSFSIITTNSNSLMESIHDRMPVILNRRHEEAWLKEENMTQLSKLLIPFDNTKMEAYSISRKVNSSKNNGSEIIVPVNIEEQGSLF